MEYTGRLTRPSDATDRLAGVRIDLGGFALEFVEGDRGTVRWTFPDDTSPDRMTVAATICERILTVATHSTVHFDRPWIPNAKPELRIVGVRFETVGYSEVWRRAIAATYRRNDRTVIERLLAPFQWKDLLIQLATAPKTPRAVLYMHLLDSLSRAVDALQPASDPDRSAVALGSSKKIWERTKGALARVYHDKSRPTDPPAHELEAFAEERFKAYLALLSGDPEAALPHAGQKISATLTVQNTGAIPGTPKIKATTTLRKNSNEERRSRETP